MARMLRILAVLAIALQGAGLLRVAHDRTSHAGALVAEVAEALTSHATGGGCDSAHAKGFSTDGVAPDSPADHRLPSDDCPECHMLASSMDGPAPPPAVAVISLPPALVVRIEASQAVPEPYFLAAAPPCGPPRA